MRQKIAEPLHRVCRQYRVEGARSLFRLDLQAEFCYFCNDRNNCKEKKLKELGPAAKKFVVHWGEMGIRWGVNRTVAQIHALLYISPRPLNAEEIAKTLSVARSNVSTSLRELSRWGIVKVSHALGDRRDYFESQQDTWEMIRLILEERKRREIDPTLPVLQACLEECERSEPVDPQVRERLSNMLALFHTMDDWYRDIMSLPSADLRRLVGMRKKVRKLLRFPGLISASPLPSDDQGGK